MLINITNFCTQNASLSPLDTLGSLLKSRRCKPVFGKAPPTQPKDITSNATTDAKTCGTEDVIGIGIGIGKVHLIPPCGADVSQ
jgi:hypothetical protein